MNETHVSILVARGKFKLKSPQRNKIRKRKRERRELENEIKRHKLSNKELKEIMGRKKQRIFSKRERKEKDNKRSFVDSSPKP